ncbi:hypothetical protein GCM10010488_11610 [Oerskovia jenensis]
MSRVQPLAEFAKGAAASGRKPWAKDVSPPSRKLAASTTAPRDQGCPLGAVVLPGRDGATGERSSRGSWSEVESGTPRR